MKCKRHFLILTLAAAPMLGNAEEWVTTQGISYLCGGVGDESLAQMKSAESSADAQLVLTAGNERSYLNDVKLTVASADKQHAVTWQAAGPVCLLKLPQGSSTVDASYGDERRSLKLNKPAKSGVRQPTVINFNTN
ncbi:hypothetical protein VVD49_20380 [Uliginosibacterium sp. H3]|uniref:Uncharacterized protein n=1 Tax=Uliginosibacterium silvisoli TaxID=3114758 RepID=A0ABU6K9A6_9RHOO|nr:hypothetical protein [Uliginosibacterium sp. H3]